MPFFVPAVFFLLAVWVVIDKKVISAETRYGHPKINQKLGFDWERQPQKKHPCHFWQRRFFMKVSLEIT